jgi:hypothetical protein
MSPARKTTAIDSFNEIANVRIELVKRREVAPRPQL